MCNFQWMGGEKLARICGRRGPLPQGSKKERKKESLQRLFGTSTEKLAIDRPSLRLAMVYSFFFLFSFCFLFHWLYDVEMLFLSHVSCPVCVCFHGVGVCAFAKFFLPLLGDIMHGVCVCILVSVLFSLRCRCTEDQQAYNGITFLKLLFWENPRHECLGQGSRAVSTPKYCCSIAFHPQLNLQSLAPCRRLQVPPQALCCPPAP